MSGLRAQEAQDTVPPDTVFSVAEISVRVARPVATAGGASALTAGLDSMRTVPSPTLDEVLRRIPLIQIRENSRGEAQPNLRGMESRRVAVLVDGVPLTLGWDDRTDLSIVPLTAAREVTLVRGLSSVLHGPNALGGVVMISIAEGADLDMAPRPARASAGIDSQGSAAAALGLAALARVGGGDLLLRFGGGVRDRSEVPLPSGVGSQVPGRDDRLNSDLEHVNGYVSARYHGDGGHWLSLSSFAFNAQKGVPPELHVAEPRLWRIPRARRWVTAISGGTGWRKTPLGEGDLEASVGLDFGETDIDAFATLAYDSVVERELGDDRTLSLRLLGDHTLGRGLLRGALTLAETRHVETLQPGGRSTFRQRLWSLGLEVERPLAGAVGAVGAAPRARLSVGFSLDGADTPDTGGRPARDAIWEWGARAGGTLVLGQGNALLHGGVSRRVRFPALRELYSGALGRFIVNPELDPEVLTVVELGVTYHRGALEAQAAGFHQRLGDAIVRVAGGDGRFRRENRDRILSTGVELLANYTWQAVSLAGDVTLQTVELEDPRVPEARRRAEYQPWIAGRVGVTVPLPFNVRGGAHVQHVGRRYCVNPDLGREQRLSADTWANLELRRHLRLGGGRGLEATFSIDNLTDSPTFDQCGLPRPGRLLRFQIGLF